MSIYGWKECPVHVEPQRTYFVDPNNPKIAVKKSNDEGYSTIIGNVPLPSNKVSSFNVSFQTNKSSGNNIFIGVASEIIDQNTDSNYNKCGLYFDCLNSTLSSEPPHASNNDKYGLVNESNGYDNKNATIGVVLDSEKAELSFYWNGLNLGVAYRKVPLARPLFPCVLLRHEGDIVELDMSDVKENAPDTSIPVPSGISAVEEASGAITFKWDPVVGGASFYQVRLNGKKKWDSTPVESIVYKDFPPNTDYGFRVRAVRGNFASEWSEVVYGKAVRDNFERSVWKKLPRNLFAVGERENNVDKTTAINYPGTWTSVIGNEYIPPGKVTSWSIDVVESRMNNGEKIFVGVAPSDMASCGMELMKRAGWYLHCRDLTLYSGGPHCFFGNKKYGILGVAKKPIKKGDSVGVIMDMKTCELSFVLNGVDNGVAYENIPLDKPLVPCVILGERNDAVKLNPSKLSVGIVDDSIPPPLSIVAKSEACDSITLTWEPVSGAVCYQVEVDGSSRRGVTAENIFTVGGLSPDADHGFRVRSVKGKYMSEWSGLVLGRTYTETFDKCTWKRPPSNIDHQNFYSLDREIPTVAVKQSAGGLSTITGNTVIPLGAVVSWEIEVLNTCGNDCELTFVGVAPFDINQNEEKNYSECGWYLNCHDSTLWSGPPFNCRGKTYGPNIGEGKHLHNHGTVGVIFDTTTGELTFVVNRVSYGVAYEEIPLDKPLLPCVLLKYKDDSVKLYTSGARINTNYSLRPVSNFTAKSNSPYSITLNWDPVECASFYQIETEGSKTLKMTTENKCTIKGFVPATGYNFRIRAVNGGETSDWSNPVKEFTQKITHNFWGWADYPSTLPNSNKYVVVEENPKIAVADGYCGCTIVGGTEIPRNRVTTWGIRILKSRDDDCENVYVGVAPLKIYQAIDNVYDKCGWYLNCYDGTLVSGPPQKYKGKEYAPKKKCGNGCLHEGSVVGVVMDIAIGRVSFIVNGVDLGVAYDGIPLDKPLAPCVILGNKNDSVEFITDGSNLLKEARDNSDRNDDKECIIS